VQYHVRQKTEAVAEGSPLVLVAGRFK
jgi:hypothetical protein